MGKLILVGEAPGGSGAEAVPALEGMAGRTLAKMMGVPDAVYLEHTTRRNLFETPDEGRLWKPLEARSRAIRLAGDFRHGDRVVLLGAKVARAFMFAEDHTRYEWISMHRLLTGETWWAALVPHPSGRNRMLNDPAERERMRKFLHEAIRDRA